MLGFTCWGIDGWAGFWDLDLSVGFVYCACFGVFFPVLYCWFAVWLTCGFCWFSGFLHFGFSTFSFLILWFD